MAPNLNFLKIGTAITVAAKKITAEPKILIKFTHSCADNQCEENPVYIQCLIQKFTLQIHIILVLKI